MYNYIGEQFNYWNRYSQYNDNELFSLLQPIITNKNCKFKYSEYTEMVNQIFNDHLYKFGYGVCKIVDLSHSHVCKVGNSYVTIPEVWKENCNSSVSIEFDLIKIGY